MKQMQTGKLGRMLSQIKFTSRFPDQEAHKIWLQTPEALVEIIHSPHLAIWPTTESDWPEIPLKK
jgi:hypothetical protein